jgi:hypothetical protein
MKNSVLSGLVSALAIKQADTMEAALNTVRLSVRPKMKLKRTLRTEGTLLRVIRKMFFRSSVIILGKINPASDISAKKAFT